jgi:hypothetical protein
VQLEKTEIIFCTFSKLKSTKAAITSRYLSRAALPTGDVALMDLFTSLAIMFFLVMTLANLLQDRKIFTLQSFLKAAFVRYFSSLNANKQSIDFDFMVWRAFVIDTFSSI